MNTSPSQQRFILLVILLIVLIGVGIMIGFLQPRDPKAYYDSLQITMGPALATWEPRVVTAISDALTATAQAPTD